MKIDFVANCICYEREKGGERERYAVQASKWLRGEFMQAEQRDESNTQ